MNIITSFNYSNDAAQFISERIDEDSKYNEAIGIFEKFISKNVEEGFLLDQFNPCPPRCFVVKMPLLRDLAFIYWHSIKENKIVVVDVFSIDFTE